jgi:hypothetical protein
VSGGSESFIPIESNYLPSNNVELGYAQALNPASWIVLGVRIEPCFGQPKYLQQNLSNVQNAPKCRHQLRLVAQPIGLGYQDTRGNRGQLPANRVLDFAMQ